MQSDSDLSAVLVELIIPHIHRRDLSSFQATSKLCRYLALPALYTDVRLNCRTSSDGSRRLFNFLRSLSENQELPPMVKSLGVMDEEHPANRSEAMRYQVIPQLTKQDQSLLQRTMESSNFPSADEWEGAIYSQHIFSTASIMLPLILWQTKNLRKLYLDYDFHAGSKLLRIMMVHIAETWSQASPGQTSEFSYLKDVTFAAPYAVRGKRHGVQNLDNVQSLFFLPAIERISVVMNERKFPGLNLLINEGRQINAASLRTLKLLESEISLDALHSILCATPNLSSLHYEWWLNLNTSRFTDSMFKVMSFMEAIYPLKSTLQQLSLSIEFHCTTFDIGNNPGWYGIEGYVDDLREWNQLTKLRLPLLILLGGPRYKGYGLPHFPQSLQELTITDDGFNLEVYDFEAPDVHAAVCAFLRESRSICPAFSAIALEVSSAYDNEIWLDDMQAVVQEQCQEVGISYQFVLID